MGQGMGQGANAALDLLLDIGLAAFSQVFDLAGV